MLHIGPPDRATTRRGGNHPNIEININNMTLFLKSTNRRGEAEPLLRHGLQILIEFGHRTGYVHPNFRAVLANYRGLLQALVKTPEQSEKQLHELVEPLCSERS